jgi:hypothetical protein
MRTFQAFAIRSTPREWSAPPVTGGWSMTQTNHTQGVRGETRTMDARTWSGPDLRFFTIRGEADQEYILGVAAYVDRKIARS